MSLRITKTIGHCTARDCHWRNHRGYAMKSAGAKCIKKLSTRDLRYRLKLEAQTQLNELLEEAITEETEKNLIDEEWELYVLDWEEDDLIDTLEKEREEIVAKLHEWKVKVVESGLDYIDNDGGLPYGVYRHRNRVA